MTQNKKTLANQICKGFFLVVDRGIEPLKTKENIGKIYYWISIRYKYYYFSFVLL